MDFYDLRDKSDIDFVGGTLNFEVTAGHSLKSNMKCTVIPPIKQIGSTLYENAL